MEKLPRPLRIAVADDDARVRDFFKRALTLLGYEVVVLAADGEELVAGCINSQPDVIITDVHMPGLNGAEAVRRIWQTRQVPAILLTGLPDVDLLKGNKLLPTPLFLMKPVPLVELRQAILRAAARHNSQSSRVPAGSLVA
jgi:CheY-like chemotaxis protein